MMWNFRGCHKRHYNVLLTHSLLNHAPQRKPSAMSREHSVRWTEVYRMKKPGPPTHSHGREAP